MGASDSNLSTSQRHEDEVTMVKRPHRRSGSLFGKVENTKNCALNPKIMLELFSLYREWQEDTTKEINQNQEELGNKIEIADALAIKLLQRFNYSVSVMKSSATHLEDVHPLQVEVGELKGKLKEVLANYDALCKRIELEGPNLLKESVKPFSMNGLQLSRSSTSQRAPRCISLRD